MTESDKNNFDVDKNPPEVGDKNSTHNIIKEEVNQKSVEEKQEGENIEILDNASKGKEEIKEEDRNKEVNSQPALTKNDDNFKKIDNADEMSHQSEPSPDPK